MTVEKMIALVHGVATNPASVNDAIAEIRATGGKVGRKPRVDLVTLQTGVDAALKAGHTSCQSIALEAYVNLRATNPNVPQPAQIANLLKKGALKAATMVVRARKTVPSVPSTDTVQVVTETSVVPVTIETTPAGEVVSVTPADVVTVAEVVKSKKPGKVKTA